MARALAYPAVFAVLLGGGHICVKHRIISELPKGNTDKYGNVYRFWKIEGGMSNAI